MCTFLKPMSCYQCYLYGFTLQFPDYEEVGFSLMILAHLHFFFCEMSCLRPVFLMSSLFLSVCQSSLFWILIKYPLHIMACFTFFLSFSKQKLIALVNGSILSSIVCLLLFWKFFFEEFLLEDMKILSYAVF